MPFLQHLRAVLLGEGVVDVHAPGREVERHAVALAVVIVQRRARVVVLVDGKVEVAERRERLIHRLNVAQFDKAGHVVGIGDEDVRQRGRVVHGQRQLGVQVFAVDRDVRQMHVALGGVEVVHDAGHRGAVVPRKERPQFDFHRRLRRGGKDARAHHRQAEQDRKDFLHGLTVPSFYPDVLFYLSLHPLERRRNILWAFPSAKPPQKGSISVKYPPNLLCNYSYFLCSL